MSTYALILAATLFFPLILSFDRKVAFWRKAPRAFLASLLVSPPFIAWDAWASARGDWSFAPEHTWAARPLGLPIEELLFFLAAPMACVFIHACVAAYLKPRPGPFHPERFLAAAAFLVLLAIPVRSRFYTATLLFFAAAFLVSCAVTGRRICGDRRFWISILVCYAPFLVVNGFLTGIPVVSYSPAAILGPRVLSIPIEDFLYSLALVGGAILAYERIGEAGDSRRAGGGAARG